MERDLSFEALFRPWEGYEFFEGLEEVSPFEDGDGLYHPATAWMLAEASMLSYARDVDLVRDAWRRAGFDTVQFFDAPGAQGTLATAPGRGVLVFRGTEVNDLHDVLTDMKFTLVPRATEGLVHSGFVKALTAVWPQIEPALAELHPHPLWIAGHSLGAALALLAGERNPDTRAVYTFGSPRVGSRGFRNAYPCPVFRLVNNNDLVTMVPPPLFYRHVGETWFIDRLGEVRADPSASEQVESKFFGHLDHATEVFREWREGRYNAIPNSNLSDHAMINYVRPLKKVAFSDCT